MKKRLALLRTLLALLLLVGIPFILTIRAVRQEKLNHALIAAIKAEDTNAALTVLKAGADPNARDKGDKPNTFQDQIQPFLDKLLHRDSDLKPSYSPTTLMLIVLRQQDDIFGIERIREADLNLLNALLEQGAEVNARDPDGNTVLDIVREARLGVPGREEAQSILLNAGAKTSQERSSPSSH